MISVRFQLHYILQYRSKWVDVFFQTLIWKRHIVPGNTIECSAQCIIIENGHIGRNIKTPLVSCGRSFKGERMFSTYLFKLKQAIEEQQAKINEQDKSIAELKTIILSLQAEMQSIKQQQENNAKK